ncbi:hypothetical protein AVEN_156433-1 [Araneus ventricosus]|uniref:Uncharacterized protein n=1 Tax=Araneus ventricosus TaxID=182803 RepID=A0A4Y2RJR8_ARAVE|nr:hypothetical protein AVEN_156433-1 [Araneus ventricosus]
MSRWGSLGKFYFSVVDQWAGRGGGFQTAVMGCSYHGYRRTSPKFQHEIIETELKSSTVTETSTYASVAQTPSAIPEGKFNVFGPVVKDKRVTTSSAAFRSPIDEVILEIHPRETEKRRDLVSYRRHITSQRGKGSSFG